MKSRADAFVMLAPVCAHSLTRRRAPVYARRQDDFLACPFALDEIHRVLLNMASCTDTRESWKRHVLVQLLSCMVLPSLAPSPHSVCCLVGYHSMTPIDSVPQLSLASIHARAGAREPCADARVDSW